MVQRKSWGSDGWCLVLRKIERGIYSMEKVPWEVKSFGTHYIHKTTNNPKKGKPCERERERERERDWTRWLVVSCYAMEDKQTLLTLY
jgi:hypothetical protein